MTDRHKVRPISLRLSADDHAWLYEHAAATGQPVRSILVRAFIDYKDRVQTDSANSETANGDAPSANSAINAN